MTRGIHLKRLNNADLRALGIDDEPRTPEAAAAPPGLLAETDPALSRLVSEVRERLEGTLHLLDQALSGVSRED